MYILPESIMRRFVPVFLAAVLSANDIIVHKGPDHKQDEALKEAMHLVSGQTEYARGYFDVRTSIFDNYPAGHMDSLEMVVERHHHPPGDREDVFRAAHDPIRVVYKHRATDMNTAEAHKAMHRFTDAGEIPPLPKKEEPRRPTPANLE
jgi:hypothetical protein